MSRKRNPEIVIDVGCHNHGVDTAAVLIDRFNPVEYYGFDPLVEDAVYTVDGTLVKLSHKAAWLHDGEVGFVSDGDASQIDCLYPTSNVPCFDFGAWLAPMMGRRIVLKLDCEGAEFALIDAMRRSEQLERLELLLVEWHIPCPVEQWLL